MGARLSALVQTDPGAYPVSYTMGAGFFPAAKWPGRGIDHPNPSGAEIKERVELYLYSHCGPSWSVLSLTYLYLLFESFGKYVQKIQVSLNLIRVMDSFHGDLCTFIVISRSVLLRMRMLQPNIVQEIKTRIICSIFMFSKMVHLWDIVEKCGSSGHVTGDKKIWHMRIACWITKATDTHSELVILIAIPLQKGEFPVACYVGTAACILSLF
jgi:hypothetical protein